MAEKLYGILSAVGQLNGLLSPTMSIKGNLGAGATRVVVKNHDELDHRDLDDQHPISAITGLSDELLSIKTNAQQQELSILRLETKIDNKIRTANEIPDDMEVGEYVFLIKGE